MKLLIGIPAYNEELMIGNVIESLPKRIPDFEKVDILVVDDGSSDNTRKVAKDCKAIVLSHIINRGLGAALKTILAYAKINDYDILITFDADGQHNPKYIKRILESILDHKANIVIGSRWKDINDAPRSRIIVNQIANIITFLLFGVKTSDSQSGLRVLDKKSITNIKLFSDGMEVSSEFFKEIYRNKLIYKEVKIDAIYTKYSIAKGQQLTNAPSILLNLILRLLR
ncbi:glycosyltransferase family 2 protein [Candidatus Gottesmanbacteria bacterium]|nr:glycosyltransferase family 2 protein [Candidatus Gottesmanbacteria bacterium]